MPTVEDRLLHIWPKIERAKHHVSEVNGRINAFLKTNPYKVAAKCDSQSREPVPVHIALIAGDAIQNLMSALDHLAYQLVLADTNDNPPNPNWIYFPIADDAAKYEAKKGGKIEGARKETLDAIDAIKPYKGGNDLLWSLYRLNNIEKHRLLLTVGSRAAGVNLGQIMSSHLKGVFPTDAVAAFESMNVFLNPADKGFPLKAGFELFIDAPDAELNPNLQFRFDVALSEPGIIEAQSLLETLHKMTNLVEGIVAALASRLG